MNNKNKIIFFVLNCVLTVFYVTLLILFVFIYKNEIVKVLLFALIGLILTLIITILFHELGHLIFGLFAGLEFSSMSLLFLTIEKDYKTKKVSVFFKKNKEFGETVMLPKSTDKIAKKIGVCALGGLIFNFIIFALCVSILLISENNYLLITFGITFVIPAYVLLNNTLMTRDNNDGNVALTLLLGGEEGKTAENYYICLYHLNNGVTPHSIPELYKQVKTLKDDYYTYNLRYLRYLSNLFFDEQGAISEIEKINLNKIKEEDFLIRIYTEKFFIAIISKDEEKINILKDVALDYLALDDSMTSLRIQATYNIYTGNYSQAKMQIESGLKCNSNEPQGIVECERKYLEYLEVGLKSINN